MRFEKLASVMVMSVAAVGAWGQLENGTFAPTSAQLALGLPDYPNGLSNGYQGFTTLSTGSTEISGWTVGGDSVDWIGTYWTGPSLQAPYSIDLSGNAEGSISQNFGTTAGQTYQVSFELAGNPDDQGSSGSNPKTGTIQATIGGSVQDFTFDANGTSHANMGWQLETYTFTAGSSSTSLSFASTTNSAYGPVIADVQVTPEPFTLCLGAAGAGLAIRRKLRK